jgi:hypothetical protein
MPTTSLVSAPYRLVVSVCLGEVTLHEVKASAAYVRNHPEFQPDFRQFVDLSRVAKLHLSFRDLYQIKHADDPFSNAAKRAVLALNDLTFGMSRMYQLTLNSAHFEVFRSLSEALSWLELAPSVLEDLLHTPPLDAAMHLGELRPRPDA